MSRRSNTLTRVALVIAAVLALPIAAVAQINAIVSGGFSAPYREVLPEFERTTGIKVMTTSGASLGTDPSTIGNQLRRGVPADLIILSREGLSEMIAEHRIVAGTDTDLAQTPLGMAVRAGAPKPDISTVESFKQTLLRAKSVTFTSSTSGVYLMTTLFPQLGIADEMAKKSTTLGVATVATGSRGDCHPAGQRAASRGGRRFRRHASGGNSENQRVRSRRGGRLEGNRRVQTPDRVPLIGGRSGGDQEKRDGAAGTAITGDSG